MVSASDSLVLLAFVTFLALHRFTSVALLLASLTTLLLPLQWEFDAIKI